MKKPTTLFSSNPYPILYSFRRCPYAMRARLAIVAADITVVLREIELRNKPQSLLTASPKATVPVLILADGSVIDQSLDIMVWALNNKDPLNWLNTWNSPQNQSLLTCNDNEFKHYLDRYKYADRYPDHSAHYYREQGALFLTALEYRLQQSAYLSGIEWGAIDAAIAPFVRQFSAVDASWFTHAPYPALREWLQSFVDSALFKTVMSPYPTWLPDSTPVLFSGNTCHGNHHL